MNDELFKSLEDPNISESKTLNFMDDIDDMDDTIDVGDNTDSQLDKDSINNDSSFENIMKSRNSTMNSAETNSTNIGDLIAEEEDDEELDNWNDYSSEYINKKGNYFDRGEETQQDNHEVFEEEDAQIHIKQSKKLGYILLAVVVCIIIVVVGKKIKEKNSTKSDSKVKSTQSLDENSEENSEETTTEEINKEEVYEETNAEDDQETNIETFQISNQDSLKIEEQQYKDYITVNKFLMISDSTIIPIFKGIAENYGKPIEFPVSVKQYNKYVNGVRLLVKFDVIKGDNSMYLTNITIVEQSKVKN